MIRVGLPKILILRQTAVEGRYLGETLKLHSGGISSQPLQIHVVTDVTEAASAFDHNAYHVVFVDDRLGIQLFKALANRFDEAFLKHLSFQIFRTTDDRSVRDAFHDYDHLVNMHHITEGTALSPGFLKSSIKSTLASYIGTGLDVRFLNPDDLSQEIDPQTALRNLVADMRVRGQKVKRNPALQATLIEEFKDVLCRLMHTFDRIDVSPLFGGFSGAGVLRVQPYRNERRLAQQVIKIGSSAPIQAEYENFTRHVQHWMSGGNYAGGQSFERTPHLGGVNYPYIEDTSTEAQAIKDFGAYLMQVPSARKPLALLRALLVDTCSLWYQYKQPVEAFNLTASYFEFLEFDEARLRKAVAEDLRDVLVVDHKIGFVELGEQAHRPDPIHFVMTNELTLPAYRTTTHGDLNVRNILVDSNDAHWLIDFRHTGDGHLLRDCASLDVSIRFNSITPRQLPELLALESALLRAHTYADLPGLNTGFSGDAELQKVFEIIIGVRMLAGELLGATDETSLQEYYIALLYHTIRNIRYQNLAIEQRKHALLSASMLAEAITQTGVT